MLTNSTNNLDSSEEILNNIDLYFVNNLYNTETVIIIN